MRGLSSGSKKLVAALVAVGALLAAVATAGGVVAATIRSRTRRRFRSPLPRRPTSRNRNRSPDMKGFMEHKGYVYSASYAPDGKRFLSVGGGTVTVWDSETRKRLFTFGRGVRRVLGRRQTRSSRW